MKLSIMSAERMEQNTKVEKIDLLCRDVIGSAITVHKNLGMGLKQRLYLECLVYELELNGISAQRDVSEIVQYKGQVFDSGVVLELLVEGQIAVVCIAEDSIREKHVLSLLNQISHSNIKLGLIINFNSKFLRGEAIKRVINGRFTA